MWPNTQRKNSAKAAIDQAIHEAMQVARTDARNRESSDYGSVPKLSQFIGAGRTSASLNGSRRKGATTSGLGHGQFVSYSVAASCIGKGLRCSIALEVISVHVPDEHQPSGP